MTARLVSVIGPPASGKTTVAHWLAEDLPAELIREDYAGNPFLAAQFQGRTDLALASQLYFLYSRVGQLSGPRWPEGGLVVSDYGFCQDAIYAEACLAGDELGVYRRLAAQAQAVVKAPDLVVALDGPEELLLERIARRGRSFERSFGRGFLASLRSAYAQRLSDAPWPVVRVDVAARDLLGCDKDRHWLRTRLREVLA